MPVPTWTPGQVLTASDVNQWFVPQVVVKASDESVTSSTALQDDNDFLFSVVANAKYVFQGFVSYFCAGTPDSSDLKFGWAFPAGLTMKWGHIYTTIGGTLTLAVTRIETSLQTPQTSNANDREFWMYGIVNVSSTAGTWKMQWAQNTSSASATIIRANSWISLQRVA